MTPEPVSHEVLQMEIRHIGNRLDAHLEDFHDVREIVFGNGEPGIAERLRNIERDLGRLAKLAWPLVTAASIGSGALLWRTVFP